MSTPQSLPIEPGDIFTVELADLIRAAPLWPGPGSPIWQPANPLPHASFERWRRFAAHAATLLNTQEHRAYFEFGMAAERLVELGLDHGTEMQRPLARDLFSDLCLTRCFIPYRSWGGWDRYGEGRHPDPARFVWQAAAAIRKEILDPGSSVPASERAFHYVLRNLLYNSHRVSRYVVFCVDAGTEFLFHALWAGAVIRHGMEVSPTPPELLPSCRNHSAAQPVAPVTPESSSTT